MEKPFSLNGEWLFYSWVMGRKLQHNHFSQPLHAKDYMSLYHSHVLKDYTKGEIPFELSMEHIRRLCANNIAEKVPFSSDFASWLHGQLSEHL